MRTSVGLALALSLSLAMACSSGPAAGSERGPCYGNGTCDTGLVCLSNLCVRQTTDGGTDDVGTQGDSGADAGVDAATSDAGAVERRTYVVDSFDLPSTGAEAM